MFDMSSDEVDFPPSQAWVALSGAERSRASSRRPQLLPRWYGPVIGILMAAYIASSDLGRAWNAPWIFAVTGGVYGLGIALAVGLVRQRQGVVTRFDRAYVAPSLVACAACLAAGGGAYAAAWATGIWARGIVGGIAAGATFWLAAALLNRRIRRDLAAAGPPARMTGPPARMTGPAPA
jgi:hypothetical protein